MSPLPLIVDVELSEYATTRTAATEQRLKEAMGDASKPISVLPGDREARHVRPWLGMAERARTGGLERAWPARPSRRLESRRRAPERLVSPHEYAVDDWSQLSGPAKFHSLRSEA